MITGINPQQFLNIVCVPACQKLQMLSQDALGLMMGTAAIESQMGRYLVQVSLNGGKVTAGGYSPFQMEEITHDDCWKIVITPNSNICDIMIKNGGRQDASAMATNLLYAAMMCRIQYSRFKEKLPTYTDSNAVYTYYKKYWNTNDGKSTFSKWAPLYSEIITLIGSYRPGG